MKEEWWFNIVLSLPDDRCSLAKYSQKANMNGLTLKKKIESLKDKNFVTLNLEKRPVEICLTEKGRQLKSQVFQLQSLYK